MIVNMLDGSLIMYKQLDCFLAVFDISYLLKSLSNMLCCYNCEQPQVSSASVNLTTETAIVWPVFEAKVVPNWREDVGQALAKHLTSCGFKSNLRGLNFCIF